MSLEGVVQLYCDGSYLADVEADDGRQECLDDSGTITYRLRAANSAGLEDSRSLSIDVTFMPGPIDPDPMPGPVDPDDPVYPDDADFGG